MMKGEPLPRGLQAAYIKRQMRFVAQYL